MFCNINNKSNKSLLYARGKGIARPSSSLAHTLGCPHGYSGSSRGVWATKSKTLTKGSEPLIKATGGQYGYAALPDNKARSGIPNATDKKKPNHYVDWRQVQSTTGLYSRTCQLVNQATSRKPQYTCLYADGQKALGYVQNSTPPGSSVSTQPAFKSASEVPESSKLHVANLGTKLVSWNFTAVNAG